MRKPITGLVIIKLQQVWQARLLRRRMQMVKSLLNTPKTQAVTRWLLTISIHEMFITLWLTQTAAGALVTVLKYMNSPKSLAQASLSAHEFARVTRLRAINLSTPQRARLARRAAQLSAGLPSRLAARAQAARWWRATQTLRLKRNGKPMSTP